MAMHTGARCGCATVLGDLKVARESSVVLAVLLGVEPAHQITLKSGESTLVASLYIADSTTPLGIELRVWGANAHRIAHLRPLHILHLPSVTLRVSPKGLRSLACNAPHRIERLDATTCACKSTPAAHALAEWSQHRHGALTRAILRPASPEHLPRAFAAPPLDAPPVDAPRSAVEWTPARIKGVRMRADNRDPAAAIKGAVRTKCGACGGHACKCGASTVYLDEEAVAVRIELEKTGVQVERVVTHCAGIDLARLLLIDDISSLLTDPQAPRRAARALAALAADSAVFHVKLERVEGEPFPRFRSIRF